MAGNGKTRGGAAGGRSAGSTSWTAWAGGAVLLVGLVAAGMTGLRAEDRHPEPREDVSHEHVQHSSRYAAYPRVEAIYAQVAEVPHVIDGIYCYCECSEHSGHYSLLDCFHDDHAARCDVCLSEATMAHRMHGEGKSLDEIRTAIDALYET